MAVEQDNVRKVRFNHKDCNYPSLLTFLQNREIFPPFCFQLLPASATQHSFKNLVDNGVALSSRDIRLLEDQERFLFFRRRDHKYFSHFLHLIVCLASCRP
jgi:hypothetical protein